MHEEVGETTPTRMQMNATSNNENFQRNERNSSNSPHVRGKMDDFCSTGNWWDYIPKHKVVKLLKLVHNVGARWDGRAEPARRPDGRAEPARTRTFFFLECQRRWPRLPPPG